MVEGAEDSRRIRVTAQLRELRFDAGSLSLNLIATVGRRPSMPVERMGDIERLRTWCERVGLDVHPGEDMMGLLDALHELRACAYDITTGYLHRHAPREASVHLLNRLARPGPPAPSSRWAPMAFPPQRALPACRLPPCSPWSPGT